MNEMSEGAKKIKLSTSIDHRDWKTSFFYEGFKAKDLSYQGMEHPKQPGILVQQARWPFHYLTGRFLVVEFEKEENQILPDPDVWESKPTPRDRGAAWYGHYVNRIKPTEIIKVYPVVGTMKRELYKGKMEDCLHLYTANGKKIW